MKNLPKLNLTQSLGFKNNKIKFFDKTKKLNLTNNFGSKGLYVENKKSILKNKKLENDNSFEFQNKETTNIVKKNTLETEKINSILNNSNNNTNLNTIANNNPHLLSKTNSDDKEITQIENSNNINLPFPNKDEKNDTFLLHNQTNKNTLVIGNNSNNDLQSTLYKSGFNSTMNLNFDSSNNVTSSLFRTSQINLAESNKVNLVKNLHISNINESLINSTDSNLNSNRSNPKKKISNGKKNSFNDNKISIIENISEINSGIQNKYIGIVNKPILQIINQENISESSSSNSQSNLNKISQINFNKSDLMGFNKAYMTEKSNNYRNLSNNNNNFYGTNPKESSNFTNASNPNCFNKTFHSNSLGSKKNFFFNSTSNLNNYDNNSNSDFFSTQIFDFKTNQGRKRALPHLMKGFASIENIMTDIKSNFKVALKELDDGIDNSEKHKNKYVKEFDVDSENTNDVFLYGDNGEGYYMSNQKVMKESELLKNMKSENIFKHKKFFRHRFDLETKGLEQIIENGLNRGTESRFKRVEDYLKETEEMKKRAIKHIEQHQFKMKMEALNENSQEDIFSTDN